MGILKKKFSTRNFICPWKTITHVKKVKKNARENLILPVKKTKNREKKAFTPTFFFTPKKKHYGQVPKSFFLSISKNK